ncbi:hypothetical protein [Nocardia sp. NPDC050406]|uniref:hypothetical protein n=1 Tax=Nocardia sp. NPDC050406 TaxID=3364318 RepID=UPI0037AC86C7
MTTGRPLPRDWGWRVLHSLWVLPSLLCFGFTTWMGFLYIGIRTRHRVWLMSAFAHFAGAVLLITLIIVSGPTKSEIDSGAAQRTATQEMFNNFGAACLFVLWLAGVVHSLIVLPQFWRALDQRQAPPPMAPYPGQPAPTWPPGHTGPKPWPNSDYTPAPQPITPVPPSAPTVHWPDGGTNPHR